MKTLQETNKTVTVYELAYLGEKIIHTNIKDMLQFLEDEILQNLDEGDESETDQIVIRKNTMRQSEIDSLREFDGF